MSTTLPGVAMDSPRASVGDDDDDSPQFQSVIDATAIALVGVDVQGRTVLWNRAAESLFGWARHEVLGREPPIIPASLEKEWRLQMRQVLEGGRGADAAEAQRLGRDGRVIPVLRSSSPLHDARGRIVGILDSLLDITAHKQLDEESRALSQVRERELIAMDLHDGLIQSLYAVALGLATAARTEELDPTAARGALQRGRDEIEHIIDEARSYVLDLRARAFAPRDLLAGLRVLMDGVRLNARLEPHVEIDPLVNDRLMPEARAHVLYIAREALSNILRHAQATEVRLTLRVVGDAVHMTIADNGRGFNPSALKRTGRHGLRNMASRARLSGGRLQLHAEPGKGTELRLDLPTARRPVD
jgi:PAS domain S-box-containing protein